MPQQSDQALVPVHVPVAMSRDHRAALAFAVLAVLAAGGSLMFAMIASNTGVDMCRTCEGEIGMAVYGLMGGGIVLGGMVASIGVWRARRRGDRTWPWPATALLLIVVSGAAGLVIIHTLSTQNVAPLLLTG